MDRATHTLLTTGYAQMLLRRVYGVSRQKSSVEASVGRVIVVRVNRAGAGVCERGSINAVGGYRRHAITKQNQSFACCSEAVGIYLS